MDQHVEDLAQYMLASNNEFIDLAPTPAKNEDLRQMLCIFCVEVGAFNVETIYRNVMRSKNARLIETWHRYAMLKVTKGLLEHVRMSYMAIYFDYKIKHLCEAFKLYGRQYMSVSESCSVIRSWASFQHFDINELIESVVEILDRKVNKKNTLLLIGESNAGKTILFTEPLADLCVFVGRLTGAGQSSEFYYMECVNQRLITVDEILLTREMAQIFKVLLGGETMNANTKHTRACIMERTPVIMTSNHPPWALSPGDKQMFLNRCYLYDCKTCPFLKNVNKIHPLAWPKLANII